MRLAQLVDAVTQVRQTTKKSEKVRLLADALRLATARQIELAACYLSGALPQGRIGIGWSLIQHALTVGESTKEPLTLQELDDVIDRLAEEQGAGSTERRTAELRRLFSRVASDERRFL